MSDEYRPIETAPRCGTEIEVMDPEVGSLIMRRNPTRETFWSQAGGVGFGRPQHTISSPDPDYTVRKRRSNSLATA